MHTLTGLWQSSESEILKINVTDNYAISISSMPPSEYAAKTTYAPMTARLKVLSEDTLQIQTLNKANNLPWRNIHYRFLNNHLQWHNGQCDFLFERVSLSDLPHEAQVLLQKQEARLRGNDSGSV